MADRMSNSAGQIAKLRKRVQSNKGKVARARRTISELNCKIGDAERQIRLDQSEIASMGGIVRW